MTADRPNSAPALLGVSRSAPTLAVSYNLRQFAYDKKHILPERPASTGKLLPLEKIDLLGGNGRWRQRKAKVLYDQRAIEEAEARRQQKLIEAERARKQELREKRRKAQIKEEEDRRRDDRERGRREAEEREQKRREADERKRLEREEEEREWLRRQPKMCPVCEGNKLCKKCHGKGYFFCMFLVEKVDEDSLLQHGRMHQGCEDCGGYRHNILGDLKKGTGRCANCNGVGKITPKLDPWTPGSRKKIGAITTASGGATINPAGVEPESP